MDEKKVRLMVVDDQRLMRDGISSLLSIQEGINVVGMAGDGQEAIQMAQELQPDVILMDVRMPVMDGVEATVQIRQILPDCQVLMLTTFDDEEYIVEALKAGAIGYMLKDLPAADLAESVRMAARGIYQLDPAAASKVIGAIRKSGMQASEEEKTAEPQSAAASYVEDLTDRELEVLQLVAQGMTNREIAERLFISEGTVKNHVSNILGRLGLRDRTQAAVYAHEHGLIDE